jgi:hypothetical protein
MSTRLARSACALVGSVVLWYVVGTVRAVRMIRDATANRVGREQER